jgi:uncharacterized membrane protein
MDRFKAFIQTVFIGGVVVLLPIMILILVFSVIIKFATGLIAPLTHLLEANFKIAGFEADVVVIALILVVAFLVGLMVKTKLGKMAHDYIEQKFLENTPGYKMIKETTAQLMSGKQSPLSKVALVKPFSNESLMTAFITHEHADGNFTVFVPMSPPTSGFVFHLKSSQVHPIDVNTEEAMKTIIGLGTGSGKLMERFHSAAKS